MEVLEKCDEPVSRRKISDETGYNPIKVSHLLQKLLKKKEIKFIELDRVQAGKKFGMKGPFRRTRLYYV